MRVRHALALAPLLLASCSCGQVDGWFPYSHDVRLHGHETCGRSFSSFMGDMSSVSADTPWYLIVQASSGDLTMQADLDQLFVTAWLSGTVPLEDGASYSVADATLSGDAYWGEMQLGTADLLDGTFDVDSVGEADDYGDRVVKAAWDLRFGEPGNGSVWLLASGDNRLTLGKDMFVEDTGL